MPGRPRASRLAIRVLGVVVAATLLAGCRVRAVVSVGIDGDGRGTVVVRVELDAAAVRRVQGFADDLDAAMRLDGIVAAGWTVEPWTLESDGGASLVMRAGFEGERQLLTRLESLAIDGVDVGVDLDRGRGIVRRSDRASVDIDARQLGTGLASDRELAASLQNAGLRVASTDAAFSQELRNSLRISVQLRVPGSSDRVNLSPGETVTVAAQSSSIEFGRIVRLLIGALVVGLGALIARAARATRSDRLG